MAAEIVKMALMGLSVGCCLSAQRGAFDPDPEIVISLDRCEGGSCRDGCDCKHSECRCNHGYGCSSCCNGNGSRKSDTAGDGT